MMNLPDILARPGSILLDNSLCRRSSNRDKRSHLFQNPIKIVQCSKPADVPAALAELDRAVDDGLFAAGYLAYECGYQLAGGRFGNFSTIDWGAELGYPILWFGLYQEEIVLECGEVEELLAVQEPASGEKDFALTPRTDTPTFVEAIRRIHELIHEGDLYQVNYTIRFDGEFEDRDSGENALNLFRHMRIRQPVNFAAFLQLGDVQILSASPEQFFEREGALISVRPMKGTAPRGETALLDTMLETWLRTDEKNRSENLMILDLLRNDLSRVCVAGSVIANSLFEIEKYRSVIQMTSPVEGKLREGTNYQEIFSALFPSGSITGAPKIRAMSRISELESDSRGIYCGSIGFIDPAHRASFSVAIRTVTVLNKNLTTGSGGGIVWDSEAREEYDECLLKTRYLNSESSFTDNSIQLIETMLSEDGIMLLERHLRRMETSAVALGFTFHRSEIANSIAKHISAFEKNSRYKVRLLLAADGTSSISSEAISARARTPRPRGDGPGLIRLGIASATIYSGNPFLSHKTTFRAVQENAARNARDRELDEVIFLNEHQCLTEGTITNIFLRHGNQWRTPATECGLLPGIGREIEMESTRQPGEALLTVSDLRSADEIMLTNAVRGPQRAEFVE